MVNIHLAIHTNLAGSLLSPQPKFCLATIPASVELERYIDELENCLYTVTKYLNKRLEIGLEVTSKVIIARSYDSYNVRSYVLGLFDNQQEVI